MEKMFEHSGFWWVLATLIICFSVLIHNIWQFSREGVTKEREFQKEIVKEAKDLILAILNRSSL